MPWIRRYWFESIIVEVRPGMNVKVHSWGGAVSGTT